MWPKRFLNSHTSSNRGSTMVQFALISPILFLLVLGILDYGRYESAETLLEYAAYQAALKASTTPNLDSDINGIGTQHPIYENFVQARGRVCEVATRFLKSTMFSDSATASGLQLRQFRHADSGATGGRNYDGDCIVLRPGEQATDVLSSAVIAHPSLAPTAGVPPAEDPKTYLNEHDIVVGVSADINMILPIFGGRKTITVFRHAKRQFVPESLIVVDPFNPSGGLGTTSTTTTVTTTTTATTSSTTTTGCYFDWIWCTAPGPGRGAAFCPTNGGADGLGRCPCALGICPYDPE